MMDLLKDILFWLFWGTLFIGSLLPLGLQYFNGVGLVGGGMTEDKKFLVAFLIAAIVAPGLVVAHAYGVKNGIGWLSGISAGIIGSFIYFGVRFWQE